MVITDTPSPSVSVETALMLMATQELSPTTTSPALASDMMAVTRVEKMLPGGFQAVSIEKLLALAGTGVCEAELVVFAMTEDNEKPFLVEEDPVLEPKSDAAVVDAAAAIERIADLDDGAMIVFVNV